MRKLFAFLAALMLAGIALVSGAASPASATAETGHTQNIVVNNAIDWTLRVVWNTSFNSVGTSSTEPDYIQLKLNGNVGTHKNAVTMWFVFRALNAPNAVYSDHSVPCVAPIGTAYANCQLPAMTNVRLTDDPQVVIFFYDLNGNLVGSTLSYLYK